MPVTEIASLDDVLDHLNKSNGDDDAELEAVIEAATDIVEGIVGPVIEREVTETLPAGSSGLVLLRTFPVLSVTSVDTASFGQAVASYVTADLTLDASGIVRVTDGTRLTGDATVTYMVGRESVPAAVKWGLLELVRHMWETQRGRSASRSIPGYDEDEPTVSVGGFLVPNRVAEALRQYALPPAVA